MSFCTIYCDLHYPSYAFPFPIRVVAFCSDLAVDWLDLSFPYGGSWLMNLDFTLAGTNQPTLHANTTVAGMSDALVFCFWTIENTSLVDTHFCLLFMLSLVLCSHGQYNTGGPVRSTLS